MKMTTPLIINEIIKKKRIFTFQNAQTFGDLVEDHNKIHFDDEYSKNTIFGQRIVHGMLAGGFISGIIATRFPNGIYRSQNYRFIKPIYFNEEIEAILKVVSFSENNKGTNVKIETNIYKKDFHGDFTILSIAGDAEILLLCSKSE